MKIKPILTAIAVAVTAVAQPAWANFQFTQNEKGEVTHYNGIELLPIPTVEEAKAQAQKEIAAAKKAREAQQAEQPATRHSSPATPPQEFFFTGKPFLEESGQYLFLFRHYDPEVARWTTADPSGFPDGANNWHYVANMVTLGIDPDGLQFLHFNGSSITVWSGSGRQSDGSIDWGTAGTSWSSVSGGSGGAASIPNGWWETTGFMTLGGIQTGFFPERSVMEGDILFAGTMSSWDTSSGPGYGLYAFQGYGGVNRFGYDTTTAGGTAPNIIEYKVGLRGIHGNPISIHKGHRIHPTMAGSTSGCIGVTGHGDAGSFQTFIGNNMGIALLVE
jgi:RHS repeat-associated protein